MFDFSVFKKKNVKGLPYLDMPQNRLMMWLNNEEEQFIFQQYEASQNRLKMQLNGEEEQFIFQQYGASPH